LQEIVCKEAKKLIAYNKNICSRLSQVKVFAVIRTSRNSVTLKEKGESFKFII